MTSRPLSAKEQKFFGRFFDELTKASIPYLLLRNYTRFPAEIGHDLDVFFPSKLVGKALELFRGILKDAEGRIVHIHRRSYFTAVWFAFNNNAKDALHIDFYQGAFTWHGLPFLDEKKLLAEKSSYQGYSIPRPAHEAYSLAIISLMWGGFFKERYRPEIQSLLSSQVEKDALEACYNQAFGGRFSEEVLESAPEKIKGLCLSLRHRLTARFFSSHPFRFAAASLQYWLGELFTIINPPGLHLAFIEGGDCEQSQRILEQIQDRIGDLFGNTIIVETQNAGGNLRFLFQVWKAVAKNWLIISRQTDPSRYPFPKPDLTIHIPSATAQTEVELLNHIEEKVMARLNQKFGKVI